VRTTTMAAGIVVAATAGGCDLNAYDCYDHVLCEDVDGWCPGVCVPVPPADWKGPYLLWQGPAGVEAPACLPSTPTIVYEGYGGLKSENVCPSCRCSEPACVLPSGITASSLSACPGDGPGATLTSLEAPAFWDGSCVSPGGVPPELVGSFTIAPATERRCAPVSETVLRSGLVSLYWNTRARACAWDTPAGACDRAGEGEPQRVCLDRYDQDHPLWLECVVDPLGRNGLPCPEGYNDERSTFYRSFQDTRACTACTCEESAASVCSAFVSVSEDETCSAPVTLSILVTDVGACIDPPPGVRLGSMMAAWGTNEPGACVPSGGVPQGEVVPEDPMTFCCKKAER
jgi:hypothetical protein